jgi:acetylornithine deacetylase
MRPFGSPTASDWIFLHDVPTVKIGPGSSELSHTADESIPKVDLLKAVQTYKSIIRAFFEQDL